MRVGSLWDKRIPELLKYREQGLTLQQIANIYGASAGTICWALSDNHISRAQDRQKVKPPISIPYHWVTHRLNDILRRKMSIRNIEVRKGLVKDIADNLKIPESCPILGIKLNYSLKTKGQRSEDSPSLDKIIPSRGYAKGNIVIISWRANRIKNDGTWEEHQKIADFYKNMV